MVGSYPKGFSSNVLCDSGMLLLFLVAGRWEVQLNIKTAKADAIKTFVVGCCRKLNFFIFIQNGFLQK